MCNDWPGYRVKLRVELHFAEVVTVSGIITTITANIPSYYVGSHFQVEVRHILRGQNYGTSDWEIYVSK